MIQAYRTLQIKMSLFDPFIPPKPTVKCECGWEGVGIQTKLRMTVTEDGTEGKPTCPSCGNGKGLSYIKKENQT